MLVSTTKHIGKWFEEHNDLIDYKLRPLGYSNDFSIYIEDENHNYMYEIGELRNNEITIWNREAVFNGTVTAWKDCNTPLNNYKKLPIGRITEKDLEKINKVYYNKMIYAKKQFKLKQIQSICKETIDD